MELMTTEQAAKRLQISYSYLRQLVCKRKIPHIKLNSIVRFEKDELDNWIKQHRVPERVVLLQSIRGLRILQGINPVSRPGGVTSALTVVALETAKQLPSFPFLCLRL